MEVFPPYGDIDTLERRVSSLPPPNHVAVIMDGNGRWAQRRGLPRVEGHRRALAAVRETVRTAGGLGVSWLTLFVFSSENWRRPASEVGALMDLVVVALRRELNGLDSGGIRVRAIGRWRDLPRPVVDELDRAIRLTSHNTRMTLVLAINYGARTELVDAARDLASTAVSGRVRPTDLGERDLVLHLHDPELPSCDLVIRSGGEQRLSNFLLWHAAYAELHFTPVLWPDFGKRDLLLAIDDYHQRQRRFGGLPEGDDN